MQIAPPDWNAFVSLNIIFLKTLNPILLISEIDRILTKYGLIPLDLRLEKHILNRVNKEPIIIILSEGIDPTESLLKYCQENQRDWTST